MKQKWLVIVCVLLAVVGCRPRGVLSNKEMREVLYDLHRADGAIQVAGYNYSHDQEVAGYYKNALDKHGITQAQFDSSLVWFTDNPQIFNKIYPKVIARLEADFEVEKQIRDKNREKKLSLGGRLGKGKSKQPVRQLRDVEEVKNEMRNGLETPWKEWKSKDFCDKNVIIFGQVQADTVATNESQVLTDTVQTFQTTIPDLPTLYPLETLSPRKIVR